jgi:hypothetical protein
MRPFHWINTATPGRRVQVMRDIFTLNIVATVCFTAVVVAASMIAKSLSDENDSLVDEINELRDTHANLEDRWLEEHNKVTELTYERDTLRRDR